MGDEKMRMRAAFDETRNDLCRRTGASAGAVVGVPAPLDPSAKVEELTASI
jgi:hypothetical protein